MKFIRILILAVILATVTSLLLWAWNAQSVEVIVASVHRGKLIESIRADGVVLATRRSTIDASTTGALRPIDLRSGDVIRKDQVLAVLDPPPPTLLDARTIAVAEAKHQAARADWDRSILVREVASNNLSQVQKKRAAITSSNNQPRPLTTDLDLEEKSRKQELELAESAEVRALSEMNSVRAQLGLEPMKADKAGGNDEKGKEIPSESNVGKAHGLEIRSPIDGHILQVYRRDPGLVAAGTPLVEIGDLDELEYGFDILTTEAVRIRVGTQVRLRGWGEDPVTATGTVQSISRSASRRISPLGNEELRTRVTVGGAVGSESLARLGDGFRIEGEFEVGESFDVLKMPLGSLFRKEGAWYVFRARDGRAVETKVELGPRNDKESSVISGVDDHSLIIMYPSNRIQNGSRISVR